MKKFNHFILIVFCGLAFSASSQLVISPSSLDACQCTGSASFTPALPFNFSFALYNSENASLSIGQNQSGVVILSNLCPAVYHIVIEYTNGVVFDEYFEVSAGATSIGDAHKVIVCLEAYVNGSGGSIPFDLTPELSSFTPGGTWYTPNGLIIPTADLSVLTASTLESGWYTYVMTVGGCDVTSGIYLQANNTGLTTTYVICETYEPFAMIDFMQGTPDTIGTWFDAGLNVISGGVYNPATMSDALFTYVIDNLPGCQPVFRSMFVDEQTQRSAGSAGSALVCVGSSPFNMLTFLADSPNDGGSWNGPSGLVTPAGSDMFNPASMLAGVYTYSISSSAPCSTQTSILTVTFTQENPSGLNADIELCSSAGNLTMLNALNGTPLNGGVWTNANGQVVDGSFDPGIEPAGNYTYYFPNVGCDPAGSTLSISVEATVNAGSNGTATICQTDNTFSLNTMLSATANGGGVWLQSGNPISAIYTPAAAGSFAFIYRVDADVCADDQASFTVFVQPAVAEPLSQSVYLCSLGSEVDLSDYFPGLANLYFENQNGALVGNLFNPASEPSVVLEVINPSGNACPDQEGQLTVQVLQPVIDNTTLPFDVCRSTNLFNLNSTLPGAAVGLGSWLDVNGNANSNSVSIDFLGTESYVYEVIQPIACGGDHLQIDLITFTPNNAGQDVSEIFCVTDSPMMLDNLLPSAASGDGSWYFNNAPFSSTSFDPGTNSSGIYIYRIQANGPCPADEAQANLNVQLGVNYTAGSDVHVCAGSTGQSIGSTPAPEAVYNWSPVSGLNNAQSAQPTVNIPSSVNQTSTVIYTVIADDGICSTTDFVSVIVEPNPIINLEESYDICFGESLTLNNVSGANCSWTPASLFVNADVTSPKLQPASSVYIGVEAVSDFGCTVNAYSQINVNPLPVLILQPEPAIGCRPVALMLFPSSESQHIDQIVWNVSGLGTFISDTLDLSLTQAGVYDIEATAISENNCVSSAYFEEIAEVYPSPVAQFTSSPNELTTLEPEAEFTNNSVGAIAYQWWFNGLDESTEINPTYTFPNDRSNTFYICLAATNNYGCQDTTCRYLFMDAEYVVYAPNAFTPDSDGDNDLWRPVVRGFDTSVYELSIFNRWGDVVFYTKNPEEPWTGDIGAGDFFGQNEVYNWRVKLKVDNSSDELFFTGSIVLIR